MKTRRVLLGRVGVDSGQLMITDPCYVKDFRNEYDDFDPRLEATEYSYLGACDATMNSKDQGGELYFENGVNGAGVVFKSGWGDGVYKVYATIEDFGDKGGERITKVEIELS